MKTLRICHVSRVLVVACLAAAATASAQSGNLPFRAQRDGSVNHEDLLRLTQRPAASDRITDEELEAIKARHRVTYDGPFRPTEETQAPPSEDLYASSIILSDGVNHTLLPLRSIVFLPERHQRRVVEEPVGKLILWPDFQQINRSWLRTLEISLETAKGEEPMEEELQEQLAKGFQVVVSVYKNSPISLMPLREPPAEEAGEESNDADTGDGVTPARPASRFSRR